MQNISLYYSSFFTKNRPLIKICGNKITSECFKVASFKPDMMGWIFSPLSPRRVEVEKAIRIIRQIRDFHPEIYHVGVFAGNSIKEIMNIVQEFIKKSSKLDFLQVVEGSGFIIRLRNLMIQNQLFIPVIPVIRPDRKIIEDLFIPTKPSLFWILDRFDPVLKGGTGKTIPEEFFSNSLSIKFILAGGINPENAVDLLKKSSAMGIDVSSGVEDAPGYKNKEKLQSLFNKIYSFSYS